MTPRQAQALLALIADCYLIITAEAELAADTAESVPETNGSRTSEIPAR